MFNKIQKGSSYSRPQLAKLWGYASFHAIARGVITPKNTNKIILFVTEEKQSFQEQYQDRLCEGVLFWEGPTDHFAEQRILTRQQVVMKYIFFTVSDIIQTLHISECLP